jgi:hypothetical protein
VGIVNLAVTVGIERRIRIASGIAYATSLLVSVIFFEYQISFLSQGKFIILSAYVSVVLFAALVGYKLSHWYFPVENSQPKLEVLLVPIIVVFVSSFGAGLIFGIASEIALIENFSKLFESLQLGIFSGAMFMVGACPVLLITNIVASIFVVEYQKKLLTSR